MNGYRTRTPRVALAVVAVAMTTITLAVTVVAPAKLEAAGYDPRILDASRNADGQQTRLGTAPDRPHDDRG